MVLHYLGGVTCTALDTGNACPVLPPLLEEDEENVSSLESGSRKSPSDPRALMVGSAPNNTYVAWRQVIGHQVWPKTPPEGEKVTRTYVITDANAAA